MSFEASVDLVGKNGGQGAVASQLTNSSRLNIGRMRPFIGNDGKTYMTVYKGGDPTSKNSWAQLQVNAPGTLRRDEWKMLDEAVLGIAEKRLTGISDLISKGLTYNLGNGMGTTVLEYHDISDAMEAQLSMDAVTRGDNDRPEFNTVYLPLPIIHVDYEINQRVLENSRRLGNPLDVSSAERAARKVSEKLEDMLFTDTSYSFGGGAIYSYLNFPNRIHPAGGGFNITDWSLAGTTGETIVNEVLLMKQAAIDDHFYGPYTLYIPTNFETKMDKDYSSSKGSNTIRERILAINNIQDVVVVDTLPASNVVLVQMTSDVVRLVNGMGMQNVEWSTEGGMVNKFKVMTIQVPQIRADQNGRTGIVHSLPA